MVYHRVNNLIDDSRPEITKRNNITSNYVSSSKFPTVSSLVLYHYSKPVVYARVQFGHFSCKETAKMEASTY